MGAGSTAEAREEVPGEGSLALVPTFIVVAVDATGMGIILPLLPFYSQRLGATPFLIGALISVYAVCQLIAGPVVGILSDRYGRRKVLVVSQIGTFVGFVLLAMAGSLTLVFLARIIDGLTSGNISVAHAYAAEHSAPSTRKQALGMTSGAIGTGLLVGPALSGLLVHYGDTAPVWAAAALSLVSILATIGLLSPDHPASEPLYQQRVPEPTLAHTMLEMRYAWRLLCLLIVFFFVNSMFLSQIGLFLSARFSWDGHPFGTRELGWMFAYAGFINMVVQGFFITRANLLVSDRNIVTVAFAGMGLGFLGLAIGNRISLLVVFLTLIIIGTMFARSTLTAELSRSTAINRQGMIMGLNQSLMSGASISAPLLSGALIGHQLFVSWALAMAVIATVGAALARQLLAFAEPAGAD
ncbi:MFS transporter [Bradyrhizobium sp. LTSPM299]|uniref:MFS transporter n=1 Tax=Bradyrhizobium sp. LTSPM299 TaxID=1619233 RepID=UPI0005C9AA3D|nr:MFS transporter [Bradyrhizobium sp. LTSPM299]KJC57099.1 MFS transporter [Bradyrhizobium sp. LTSPM299]